VVKLVVEEPESAALRALLTDGPRGSCELAVAEAPRAVRRVAAGRAEAERQRLLARVDATLDRLTLLSVDREALRVAGGFEDPGLRSLDAVHIASALSIAGDLDAFVSYDARQLEAAAKASLPVVSPGAGTARS